MQRRNLSKVQEIFLYQIFMQRMTYLLIVLILVESHKWWSGCALCMKFNFTSIWPYVFNVIFHIFLPATHITTHITRHYNTHYNRHYNTHYNTHYNRHNNVYRITETLKVETDIVIDNVCWDLQNWRYCFHRWHDNVTDVTLTDNFQYQNQFVEIDNIT